MFPRHQSFSNYVFSTNIHNLVLKMQSQCWHACGLSRDELSHPTVCPQPPRESSTSHKTRRKIIFFKQIKCSQRKDQSNLKTSPNQPYEARYEADFRFFEILVNMVNAVNVVNVVNMVIGVFFLHVFSFVTRQSAGKHGKHGKLGKHGKHVVHCTSAFFTRQTAGKHGKRGKHGKLDNFSPVFFFVFVIMGNMVYVVDVVNMVNMLLTLHQLCD